MTFQPLDTPLVMSGFLPGAIRFWQQQTAGTSLEPVAAGGSLAGMPPLRCRHLSRPRVLTPMPSAHPALEPGSAVSMQLIRGDLEVSATCTVTWIDPKQLLACGHPVLGAGPVSLPMTTADVVATLASPLNSFKIINTGVTVGAFTQDRESAIRGVLWRAGAHDPRPRLPSIPLTARAKSTSISSTCLPSLPPPSRWSSTIRSSNRTRVPKRSATTSPATSISPGFHSSRSISGPRPASQLQRQWRPLFSPAASSPASIRTARARALFAPSISTFRPFPIRSTSRSIRRASLPPTSLMPATPSRSKPLSALRISPSATSASPSNCPPVLPRATFAFSFPTPPPSTALCFSPAFAASAPDLATVLAEARDQHAADHIYVSLLAPETQAEIHGQTFTSLPLSVANALEPLRNAQDAGLNGESAELMGEAPAGGVLSGFWILNLNIESGGGLN